MQIPYLKPWHARRTRTPPHYNGSPLHLHRVPETEKEWCGFAGDVEIYVIADTRQAAKEAAQRNTPSRYGQLNWKK